MLRDFGYLYFNPPSLVYSQHLQICAKQALTCCFNTLALTLLPLVCNKLLHCVGRFAVVTAAAGHAYDTTDELSSLILF